MLSERQDSGVKLGHLLSKHYFSDIAEESEWRNACSEEAAFVLRRKLARERTEAVLTGTAADQDLPRRRGSKCRWESANPEPLRVNKSRTTFTASLVDTSPGTSASDERISRTQSRRVQTYSPSGTVLVTDPQGESRPHIPERSGERRVRFSLEQAASDTHYETEPRISRSTLVREHREKGKMGESRQELLAWLNGLLQLNVTKVEQCGTGAAFCQIYDSIFLDLPMARVKFNANSEYQYLENFKILQNTFRKHHVDRPVNTEQLVKCKMQDNLEFLQWSKRYWDQYFPGGDYDPVSRRKGAGGVGGGANVGTPRAAPATSAARRPAGGAAAPRAGSRQAGGVGGGAASAALQAKNAELMETVQGLERERDFYFSKLRDIELLIQQAMEADPSLEEDEGSLLKQIQTILYSTEEGFEIPQEGEGELVGEEETF